MTPSDHPKIRFSWLTTLIWLCMIGLFGAIASYQHRSDLPEIRVIDRRGIVSIWLAIMIPTMILAVALPVEVGNWAVTRLELQRTADLAALAGMLDYKARFGEPAVTKELHSLNAATIMVRMNRLGAMKANAETVSGLANDGPAIAVTVVRVVPFVFMGRLVGHSDLMVSVTATAELIGPEPNEHETSDHRFAAIVH